MSNTKSQLHQVDAVIKKLTSVLISRYDGSKFNQLDCKILSVFHKPSGSTCLEGYQTSAMTSVRYYHHRSCAAQLSLIDFAFSTLAKSYNTYLYEQLCFIPQYSRSVEYFSNGQIKKLTSGAWHQFSLWLIYLLLCHSD